MNPKLRNSLIGGGSLFLGGLLNMRIISSSGYLIPPPVGSDLTTEAGLQAAMPLMQPIHFLLPFLAHALGTLLAAYLVSKWGIMHQKQWAIGIGFWFLLGGTMMVFSLPTPLWFAVVDLGLAYIPMGYLGYYLGSANKN